MKDNDTLLRLLKIEREIENRKCDALANYNTRSVHQKQINATGATAGYSGATAPVKPSAERWKACGLQEEYIRFAKTKTAFRDG